MVDSCMYVGTVAPEPIRLWTTVPGYPGPKPWIAVPAVLEPFRALALLGRVRLVLPRRALGLLAQQPSWQYRRTAPSDGPPGPVGPGAGRRGRPTARQPRNTLGASCMGCKSSVGVPGADSAVGTAVVSYCSVH